MFKTLPGISILQDEEVVYCTVADFSDDLKGIITSQLAGVWNGFAEVEENPAIHSYKRTLASFLDRYRGKTEETKKGMIGELLAHILISHFIDHFSCLSVLKNKEDRSIKKGFDIIYYEATSNRLWYSEVKSGRRESGTETSDVYNTILLKRSHASLSGMLSEGRQNLWDNALIDVGLTIRDRSGKVKLQQLLDNESPVHDNLQKKNAILISVLYHCPSEPISIATIKEFHQQLRTEGLYQNEIVFSIQKKTFEKVAQFLEDEAI